MAACAPVPRPLSTCRHTIWVLATGIETLSSGRALQQRQRPRPLREIHSRFWPYSGQSKGPADGLICIRETCIPELFMP